MKVRKIKSLKYRCFTDFSWPASLAEFARYNLLYGWNGSGKTTLTNLFRTMEKRESLAEGEAKVVVEGRTIDLNGISTETALPQVRVFNEAFVDENVFTSHGSVTPIFHLGEKNIEKQAKMDEMKLQREKKREELAEKQKIASEKKTGLDNYCRDRANNTIKPLLSSSGSNPYNNYNKTHYRNRSEELLKEKEPSVYELGDAEADKLKKQKEATPKESISEVSFAFQDLELLHTEVKSILEQAVVGEVLKELKENQELADWVKSGLKKHQKEDTETCLFCGQRLPEGRMKELEAHFNDQFILLTSNIDQKIESLEKQIVACDVLNVPDEAKLYDHLTASFEGAVSELRKQISLQRMALEELGNELQAKRTKFFQSVPSTFAHPNIDKSKLNDVNEIILQHNKESEDFDRSIMNAREKLEKSLVAKSLPEYSEKKKAIEEASKASCRIQNEVDTLIRQIEKLETEIVEHRKPAEELNDDLTNYLGRDDLEFKVMDTGYQIFRRDQIADSLSEGERGGIAFLYFLKSLSDKNFNLKNGIVVIDDPASSLDSNALFYAFSFMKERTKEAGQIFILTHNFPFFRQVKNWFHHLKGQKKRDIEERPARFYMVQCENKGDGRCSMISEIPPLLERYESEYHYLFSLIFCESQTQCDGNLENYYHLPNVARRVIEAFLAFKRPGYAGDLGKQLDSVDFDPEKKTRILRFLHTHSHKGQIAEPEHDFSILSETPKVLADILALIKSEDERHYEEMKSLIIVEPAEVEDV
ncbi:hypothetical protein E3J62_09550 [candidate division TA06 bacterium]|uniref:Protein CR006 P-loop domain-containing protein n=1 Tax=candidate division TA06 bacterium TaxID=2250710 RepID=A0A523UQB2_UNCT6|nr:MAG: hypothetical protein E3J62_09550 [candidate division TA06 bacterium]